MLGFLGAHYDLLLGLLAGGIWIVVIIWFLWSSNFIPAWRDKWRARKRDA